MYPFKVYSTPWLQFKIVASFVREKDATRADTVLLLQIISGPN